MVSVCGNRQSDTLEAEPKSENGLSRSQGDHHRHTRCVARNKQQAYIVYEVARAADQQQRTQDNTGCLEQVVRPEGQTHDQPANTEQVNTEDEQTGVPDVVEPRDCHEALVWIACSAGKLENS